MSLWARSIIKPTEYTKELRRLQAELCKLQDWEKVRLPHRDTRKRYDDEAPMKERHFIPEVF